MQRIQRLIIDNKYLRLFIFVLIISVATIALRAPRAHAAYDGSRLIDNNVFLDANSMNASQIQQFLVDKGAGLANLNFALTCGAPSDTATMNAYAAVSAPCGQTIPASSIIYYAARIYGVSPRVILSTMQKEQSLTTAVNPTSWQINQAMGYGCPDSTGCGASNFFYQIDNGTWALRYHYERANSNNTWWNSGGNVCGGTTIYRSTGLYAGATVTFKDDNGVGYATYTLANAATASFYCYTPHAYNNPQGLYGLPTMGTSGMYYSGSYNFVLWFERWFGLTTRLDAQSFINSLPVTIITQPYATPAIGQKLDYKVSFKNNFTYQITIDTALAVGRAGNITSGTNRDFGWQGPTILAPGASKEYTFSTTNLDTGSVNIWPAILYQGNYIQYNNWGTTITGHAANLTLSQALNTDAPTIYAGQNVAFTAKLKNNEPYPISYDAIGIPVKFYDKYNYDATWVGPGVIAAGAELSLTGTRNIDKPGPFTYWVSNYLAGTYTTLGPVKKFSAVEPTPNFSVSGITFTNTSPVLGENLVASITITNNLPVAIDVDGVGIVGRLGTFNGANRDIAWQGPVRFEAKGSPNASKTITGITRKITDVGTHYYWIGIVDDGNYIQYNNWGSTIISRVPSFSVSGITFSNASPALGENLSATKFTITNNLSVPVDVDGVGIVGRLGTFNGANRDIAWQGPVHFNANEVKEFTTGYTRTITDVGTHYYWIGIVDDGNYIQYNNWGSTIISR